MRGMSKWLSGEGFREDCMEEAASEQGIPQAKKGVKGPRAESKGRSRGSGWGVSSHGRARGDFGPA